jgi:hypothetical protein
VGDFAGQYQLITELQLPLHEGTRTVEEMGAIHQGLVGVFRDAEVLLVEANDCFEDLEYRLLQGPEVVAEQAQSILRRWRVVVRPCYPTFPSCSPPLSRPEVLKPFLSGATDIVLRFRRLIRSDQNEPATGSAMRASEKALGNGPIPNHILGDTAKRKRGPKPKDARHRAIESAVTKFCPHEGKSWREEPILRSICQALDEGNVSFSGAHRKPSEKPLRWTEARADHVTKAIEFSLKYCQKNSR